MNAIVLLCFFKLSLLFVFSYLQRFVKGGYRRFYGLFEGAAAKCLYLFAKRVRVVFYALCRELWRIG